MTEKFSLFYADPPWSFKVWNKENGLGRAPDQHYETMSMDDLKALPIGDWAEDNSLLAMWVYDPMMPEAIELAKAWGFEFITPLFRWFKTTNGQLRLFDPTPKPNFGLGYHTRGGACEECWLFGRGKGLKIQNHKIRKEFFAPLREHSRKPSEVKGWLVDLYGDVSRVELFARERTEGWTAWGNEVDKFKPPTPPILEYLETTAEKTTAP